MNFICRKVLRIGGTEYKPGEIIPDGVVLNGRVRALKSNGYISELGDAEEVPAGKAQPGTDSSMRVPIKSEGGEDMVIEMSQEDALSVFAYLQMGAEDCSTAIGTEERENVLIMVHALDARKTVKTAVKKRFEELSTQGDETAAQGGNEATAVNGDAGTTEK